MVKQLKPKKGPIMFFKNIQLAKNPFFKTLNLDRHSSLSFLTSRTTNKDIMPSGRASAELVMDAMLNGLSEEIKKTVLAPTYRKSSDGKWVNSEEMTLMLNKVKEFDKGKISPETARALWDYFLLYRFVDARALQQLGESLGKSPMEIDEAHLHNGSIKLPESIANYQPFPEIMRRDVTQQNTEIPAMVCALGLKSGVDLIVEVGCGRGAALPAVARLLQPKQLVAIDPDLELLAIARENNKYVTDKIYPGDVRRLPFANNSVDILLDFGVLYHISHSDLGLQEIARVLKPGGKYMHETRLSQFLSHPIRVAKHGRYGRSRTLPFIAVGGKLKKDRYRGLWSTRVKARETSSNRFGYAQ
ncbi:MAG: class I SAM-dependent methyltransferase [Calditrichaeota bacterium]|nr:class I SAM-dependent methyltransferase [Calditrichota bacterium]